MSNYNSLKTTINANIKQNGRQEITGQILNSVLNAMVTALGAGYQYAGIATTATNPGTPDAKVFYIANGKGTYTNFGGLQVTEDVVVVLYWDSSWHKVSTGIASEKSIGDLKDQVLGIDRSFINPVNNAWSNAIPCVLQAGVTYKISSNLTSGVGIIATTNSDGVHVQSQEIERVIYNAGVSQTMEFTPAQSCTYIWFYAGGGFTSGTLVSIKGETANLKDSVENNTQDIASLFSGVVDLTGKVNENRLKLVDLRQQILDTSVSIDTPQQATYIQEYTFIAGKSYRVINKGASGSATAYLSKKNSTSPSDRIQTISSNGIFAGESVDFIADDDAFYISGYSNTISVLEVSPVDVPLENRVSENENDIQKIQENIQVEELVEMSPMMGVLRVDNLASTDAYGYQHLEIDPVFGAKYLVYCSNTNSTYPAAFLNDGSGHYMRILGGTNGQIYSGEPISIPSESDVDAAGLNVGTTKLYVNMYSLTLFPRANLVTELNGSEITKDNRSINAKILTETLEMRSSIADRAMVFAYHIEKGVTYKIENLSATGVQQLKFLDADGNYIKDGGGNDLSYTFYSAQKYVENHTLVFVADFTADFLRVYPNVETSGVALDITGGLADVLDLSNMADEMKNLRESIAAAIYMRPMNSGCVMSIIGDSISTFGQRGYCYYYDSAIQASQYPDSDVKKVEQCYWYKLLRRQCCDLGENYSFSGSCATTGITSLPNLMDRVALVPETTDICILALGTNDSNGNAPLGEYDYDSPIADLDDTTFIGAYTKAVKTLLQTNPDMQIMFVSMKMTNTYATAMKNIAEHFGMFYVDARGYSTYDGTHPNAKGMLEIYNSINTYLSEYYMQ